MHYLLLLAAMQYLHFGIKAGAGPRYGAQPLLIDRHNGFAETWRIENGSSGDCKCYEFFISNSWPALTQRILDFLGANVLCWNVVKKLDLCILRWLHPHIIPGFCQTEFPLPLCNPCSLPYTSCCLPYSQRWHSAGSRRERRGVSECTIRSWRRLLPSLDFIAVSLGLFLQLAGQSDLWLPLLISVGSFPMSPRQICFSCGLLKGCSAMAAASGAGGSDLSLGSARGKVDAEWPRAHHVLLSIRAEPGVTCCCWHGGHQWFTEGQQSTAGTKQGGEGGHEVTPALHKAQGKITLSCWFL